MYVLYMKITIFSMVVTKMKNIENGVYQYNQLSSLWSIKMIPIYYSLKIVL